VDVAPLSRTWRGRRGPPTTISGKPGKKPNFPCQWPAPSAKAADAGFQLVPIHVRKHDHSARRQSFGYDAWRPRSEPSLTAVVRGGSPLLDLVFFFFFFFFFRTPLFSNPDQFGSAMRSIPTGHLHQPLFGAAPRRWALGKVGANVTLPSPLNETHAGPYTYLHAEDLCDPFSNAGCGGPKNLAPFLRG